MAAPATDEPGLIGAYGRAALAALPVVGKLPMLPGGGGHLPSRIRQRSGARLDAARLQALRDVTSDQSSGLPLLAPHHLAFPLHMQGMTSGDFPYPAIGTVHLDNLVERHRVIADDEPLLVAVRFIGPFPHRKGATFTIETTAVASGAVVWSERSTMLRIGARAPEGASEQRPIDVTGADAAPAGATEEEWKLPADLGRRYGAVSGDRNPIHLSGLSAKAFGFPRAIAHGMWTASRIAGSFGDDLPEAVSFGIRFEKPLLLPGTARLVRWQDAGRDEILVTNPSGEKIHARATVRPLGS